MNRFTRKSVIVTGAASGIGRASAMLFAAEGGKVVAADRSAEVHVTVAAIREAGGSAEALEMDAGAASDVAALVEFAQKTYGRLDVVLANAGISGGVRARELAPA
jgi:NAD(P)-dependent dehydrogenase (short-subunit alcohol dehydrogenase family)